MTDRNLRVALVEPYLGGSHRAWAEGYVRHSAHGIELFGLPAIHWKWRMHGAHVTLAPLVEAAATEGGAFDVVLTTSMTNVPALLGQARRSLGAVPVVLYMHENQLTFPRSPLDSEDLTYAMFNWTSMVASDLIVFNSGFHRDVWFDALPSLLARLPDQRHGHLIEAVRARSVILPVGVELAPLDAIERVVADRPLVLWNQRWEYDKGPADFLAALSILVDEGLDFDVALAGDRPADPPTELIALRSLLGDRIVHDGHADLRSYRQLLRRADIVVSTAQHEFFGIAITEAIYAGAFPLLPDREVYPERIPEAFHGVCLYEDTAHLVERLRWALGRRAALAAVAGELRPVMAACDWMEVAPTYDDALVSTVDTGP